MRDAFVISTPIVVFRLENAMSIFLVLVVIFCAEELAFWCLVLATLPVYWWYRQRPRECRRYHDYWQFLVCGMLLFGLFHA